jgi:hypothetical protein
MSTQRQKPIDFAAEGLRLALSVDRNCGIRVERNRAVSLNARFGKSSLFFERLERLEGLGFDSNDLNGCNDWNSWNDLPYKVRNGSSSWTLATPSKPFTRSMTASVRDGSSTGSSKSRAFALTLSLSIGFCLVP